MEVSGHPGRAQAQKLPGCYLADVEGSFRETEEETKNKKQKKEEGKQKAMSTCTKSMFYSSSYFP